MYIQACNDKKTYKGEKNDIHMVFIDLEKEYDNLRKIFWWVLEKKIAYCEPYKYKEDRICHIVKEGSTHKQWSLVNRYEQPTA